MKLKIVLALFAIFLAIGFLSFIQVQEEISALYSSSSEPAGAASQKYEYHGKVARIIDGDTLEIDGNRIRLALVDTPERNEPGYEEAARFTAMLCPAGSTVYLDIDDGQPTDKYGRTVAVVYCGGRNLNAELWRNGYAIDERFLSVSEFDPYSWR